jgi:hypothetical protein
VGLAFLECPVVDAHDAFHAKCGRARFWGAVYLTRGTSSR